MDFVKEK